MGKFAHLHVHSNYSLREGAARVGDLAARAAEAGMETLALTDHDGMYGAVRFTLACDYFGVRPILGAELEWGDGYHVVLLARDAAGWSNLCHLVTEMHLDDRAQSLPPGKRPRTSFESIARHSQGLIALTGCARGEVPWLASLGRIDEAEKAARRWLEVFGTDGFAIEITDHLAEPDALRNQNLVGLARSLGVKVAATNNVHYVDPADAPLHDVLDCIRRIVPITRATAPRSNAEFYLKSPEAMAGLHPPEAIEGAAWVADRCDFHLPLGEFHFPDLPPERGGPDAGQSSTTILAVRCWEGVRRRYPVVSREIDDRLQHELGMIRRGGFCGYFLLVADIVDYARSKLGIRCSCRGSAAGSLVAYALGISDVDPVRHDLVFERFMNAYRREIPDIDVDFESARREEVLTYILETYQERTAMVAMMETFRARAALREVGKALGLPDSEIDAVAKAFPHISAGKIHEALEALPEVAETDLASSRLEVLFDLSSRLDGFPRHLALHPSGVILSDERLADLMPMQSSFEGFSMSQFDKDDVEALGIAKLDVLGVRMFSSMAHTLDEVERIHGIRPDIDSAFHSNDSSSGNGVGSPPRAPTWRSGRPSASAGPCAAARVALEGEPSSDPPDHAAAIDQEPAPGPCDYLLSVGDEATFELIRDSRTMGCFQIESPGQRELLGKFQPGVFEDLIIDISLFRPGPVKSDMVRPFLERRHGFEPVSYPRPSLVPILKETNGVIVYHEQVMRVIAALTGCDLGEADKIRRKLDNGADTHSLPPVSYWSTPARSPRDLAGCRPSGGVSALHEAPDPATGKPAGLSPEQETLKSSVIDRAEARGWDRGVADRIWVDVLQFASFGFCKAHAAAFAVPTYQSAWLKAHHPAEFYSGVLTHEPGMYPRRAILADARAHGVEILGVDVNLSDSDYRAEARHQDFSKETFGCRASGLRLGLKDVKGITASEISSIFQGRPWRSVADFCSRAAVSRPVVEALVHCGGFDSLKGRRSRREILWMIHALWEDRERARLEQMSFDLWTEEQAVLPGIGEYTEREKVEAELEVLGLDASRHLLSFYKARLEKLGWTPAGRLRNLKGGSPVVVAGVKVATQTPPVKSGRRVVFVTLEDGTGQADVTLFEEAQRKYARRVFDGWILAVRGTVRRTGEKGVSVLGEEVVDLSTLHAGPSRKLWHSSGGSPGW